MPTRDQRVEVMCDILRWINGINDGVNYKSVVYTWKNIYRNEFIKAGMVTSSIDYLIDYKFIKYKEDNRLYITSKGINFIEGKNKFSDFISNNEDKFLNKKNNIQVKSRKRKAKLGVSLGFVSAEIEEEREL